MYCRVVSWSVVSSRGLSSRELWCRLVECRLVGCRVVSWTVVSEALFPSLSHKFKDMSSFCCEWILRFGDGAIGMPGRAGPLLVGEDCGGLWGLCNFLASDGVNHQLLFGSELEEDLLRLPKLLDFPGSETAILSGDILQRTVQMPSVHVYLAGFPCQPESMAGCRRPPLNKVLSKVITTIMQSLPLSFLLENLFGFVAGEARRIRFLQILRTLGKRYIVRWKKIDARVLGLPQSRPRFYIIGYRRGTPEAAYFWNKWSWPLPFPTRVGLLECLDRQSFVLGTPISGTVTRRNLDKLHAHIAAGNLDLTHPIMVDFAASARRGQATSDYSPCLTLSRCEQRGFWLLLPQHMVSSGFPLMHRLDSVDMARLQGYPGELISKFGIHIKESSFRRAVGNAINFQVLAVLVRSMVRLIRECH